MKRVNGLWVIADKEEACGLEFFFQEKIREYQECLGTSEEEGNMRVEKLRQKILMDES